MISTNRVMCILTVVLLCGASTFTPVRAQGRLSDEEIERFAAAFKHLQAIDRRAQLEVIRAVEEIEIGVQRFNEIQQAQRGTGQQLEDVTEEELQKYNQVIEEIEKIRTDAQQKMEIKIEEEGLTVSRYQEIGGIIQRDPDLQVKLQEYLKYR